MRLRPTGQPTKPGRKLLSALLVVFATIVFAPRFEAQTPATHPTSTPYAGDLSIFEEPGRDKRLQIDRVMDLLHLKPGSTIADIGAGGGGAVWMAGDGEQAAEDRSENAVEAECGAGTVYDGFRELHYRLRVWGEGEAEGDRAPSGPCDWLGRARAVSGICGAGADRRPAASAEPDSRCAEAANYWSRAGCAGQSDGRSNR